MSHLLPCRQIGRASPETSLTWLAIHILYPVISLLMFLCICVTQCFPFHFSNFFKWIIIFIYKLNHSRRNLPQVGFYHKPRGLKRYGIVFLSFLIMNLIIFHWKRKTPFKVHSFSLLLSPYFSRTCALPESLCMTFLHFIIFIQLTVCSLVPKDSLYGKFHPILLGTPDSFSWWCFYIVSFVYFSWSSDLVTFQTYVYSLLGATAFHPWDSS